MGLPGYTSTLGVLILLIAFFLNRNNRVSAKGLYYTASNIIGAGLYCASSYLIHFYQFVVLEATWAIVAAVSLFKNVPRGTSNE